MIVGVDLSTFRVDIAWLLCGRPCRWHQELGSAKINVIDRMREIHIIWPVDRVTIEGFDGSAQIDETTEVAIEWPRGQNHYTTAVLAGVAAIVTAQAPSYARVSWTDSRDLRGALGLKNTKRDAEEYLLGRFGAAIDNWDEHELDALLTCLAWTHILEHPTNTKEPHS